ncbi:MAG TPA: hypothetical protein VFX16_27965 [Pseudonocardiaceae bacterium]|nr:hypothetical protein [Pseudonocardiaceae bacterium]
MAKRKKLEDDFIDDWGVKYQKSGYDEDAYSDSGGEDSSGSATPSYDSSSEEEPDAALIQPGLRIIVGSVGDIDRIDYIAGGAPNYTAAVRAGAGGRLSTAILGPGGYVSRNSDADRAALPAIVNAEAAYPAHTFKAGHLLNAEFGGAGDDSDNLTILSTGANSRMRAFDNAIKDAVTLTLKTAYRAINNMGIDVTNLGYGIQVTITTAAGFWSNNVAQAGYLISNGVTCVAAIVGEPVPANLEAALTATYQAARVNTHAALMLTLQTAINDLQGEVAAANALGAVVNP